MTRSPKVLVSGSQLTTSAAIYYSTPANTITTISAMTINNSSGTARTFTCHLVPSGGSVGASNQIATGITIPASGSAPTIISGAIGQSLAAGGTIVMLSDGASALTPFVSGYETV